MHELGTAALVAQRLQGGTNSKGMERPQLPDELTQRNSKTILSQAPSHERTLESGGTPDGIVGTTVVDYAVMLERFKELEDGVRARLAGMEARIDSFLTDVTKTNPLSDTFPSSTALLEEPQTSSPEKEGDSPSENADWSSASPVRPTDALEPPSPTSVITTTKADFPKGVALADKMMGYFHYAKEHDREAYETYSERLKAFLVSIIEGHNKTP